MFMRESKLPAEKLFIFPVARFVIKVLLNTHLGRFDPQQYISCNRSSDVDSVNQHPGIELEKS